MKQFKQINKRFILVPKLLYFSLALFFYSLHQFRTPFILQRYGVKKKSLGNWISMGQLLSFISNIWIGRINDKSGKQRFILMFLVGMSAFICQLFFFTKNALIFWPLFFVYFSLISAAFPLLDKIVLDYLSSEASTELYGTQRIWSTFGYLCCNFIVEFLIIDKGDKKDFTNIMYYNLLMGGIVLVLMYMFIHNLPPISERSSNRSAFKKLFKNSEFMYFMVIILLSGIVRASMTLYLSDYMTSVLNLDKKSKEPHFISKLGIFASIFRFFLKTKVSITSTFGVFLEIVVFFNSKIILEKLGFFMPLFIACIGQLLRFIGYYCLHYKNKNAFAICCLLELIKGLVFGLIQTSATLLVGKFAPKSIKTTALIIFNGTYIALGTVLSGIIFGFIFDKNSKKPGLESYNEYKNVYIVNILISLLTLAIFFWKYGIRENLIFSKANADAKIKKVEEDRELEELAYEDAEKKSVEVK